MNIPNRIIWEVKAYKSAQGKYINPMAKCEPFVILLFGARSELLLPVW